MSKSFFFNPRAMRPLCSGPLTQWLDSFAERLVQQGYSDLTCRRKMRLVADLSRWLQQQRLTAAKLNEQRIAEYLRGRWRRLVRKIGDKITPHGGSLAEIGRVLRHQHIQTTEIYAKVDLSALRAMTHPWPGGAQSTH